MQQRQRSVGLLRVRGDRADIERRRLYLGRYRADEIDAGHMDQLRDLLRQTTDGLFDGRRPSHG